MGLHLFNRGSSLATDTDCLLRLWEPPLWRNSFAAICITKTTHRSLFDALLAPLAVQLHFCDPQTGCNITNRVPIIEHG